MLARALKAVALGAVLAYGAHSLLGVGGHSLSSLFEDWIYNAAILAAAGLAALRAATVRGSRSAWAALAVGLGCWALGEIVFTVDPGTVQTAFPSTSDLLWLVYYPAGFASLLLLVRARVQVFYGSLWLDGFVGAAALAALTAQFVFAPIVAATGEPGSNVVADLIYPVGDSLLMVFVIGVLALTGWRPGRQLALVGAGFAIGAAVDSWSLYLSATGHSGSTALDVLWPVSALLLGWAAWSQDEASVDIKLDGRRLLVCPVAFAGVGLVLLVLNALHSIHGVSYALAVVTLGGAVVRMAITFAENVKLAARSRDEALTDSLTGLANRRRLMLDLEDAAADASHRRAYGLVVFDLNGFKGYNDRFGHPAGDALLATLGARLDAAVAGRGTAYRLGGDEFCVLFRPGAPVNDVSVAAARAALSDRGDGVQITASYGVVELPREATDVAAALQTADDRLYAHKRAAVSAKRVERDAPPAVFVPAAPQEVTAP